MPSFSDHFSTVARDYAAFRPDYPRALFAYLAGLARARELVWDCACGNGQASVPLAEHFTGVIATDASAAQIAAAAHHARVSYRVARAEESGLAAESADLVTVAQALHWFDLPRFYAEASRVLRRDAPLAVWTYTLLSIAPEIDPLLRHFHYDVVGSYWTPERALVESGYRTLAFPFPELESPAFEIEQHWSLPHLLGYVRSWSATARYRAERGSDPVDALERELSPLWGEPARARRVSWPIVLRVGRRP